MFGTIGESELQVTRYEWYIRVMEVVKKIVQNQKLQSIKANRASLERLKKIHCLHLTEN